MLAALSKCQSIHVDLFMHGSKLSEFIQSDVPSGTLLIPNEFELGVQRSETLKDLEYSQALAKPERETITFCSPVSLSLQSVL